MENISKSRWLALLGLSLLAFTAFLDFTIVNTALPSIQRALHAPVLKLQWIINIYAIVLSVFMIMAGKFGDIFGRRKVFYLGALLFFITALGAGLAHSINALIVFRGLQGFAGAALFILGIALVPTLFPKGEQSKAIGIYSAITGLGLGLGPFLSGLLVSLFSWRWVFFINLPILLLGFLACVFVLKETERQRHVRVDWLGLVSLTCFIVPLLLGLIHGESCGWATPLTYTYFILSFIGLVLLLVFEPKREHPLLDFAIFKHNKLLLGLLVCTMAGIVSYGFLFFDPLYLSSIRHLSAFWIGSILLALPAGQVLMSFSWGVITRFISPERIIVMTIVGGLFSAILHLFFGVGTSYWFILLSFFLVGFLWGAGNTGGIGLAITHAEPEKVGGTIGTMGTLWNIAGSLAVAIGAVLFHHGERHMMKNVLSAHHMSLTVRQHDIISSMLSTPAMAASMLHEFSGQYAKEIIVYFKQAFLYGFHDAVALFLVVLLAGLLCSLLIKKS